MKNSFTVRTFTYMAAASALAGTSTADVLDVGAYGQFQSIQSALLAAEDGDVVRIARGSYASFWVPNKSVTIRSESDLALIIGSIRIQGLSAGKTVILDDLKVRGRTATPEDGPLILGFNEGSIRVQDCVISGIGWPATGSGPAPPLPTVLAVECQDLAFDGCQLGGGRTCRNSGTATAYCSGFPAVELRNTRVNFHDTIIEGGGATFNTAVFEFIAGAEGVIAVDSDVYFQDCTLRGGTGGETALGPGEAGIAMDALGSSTSTFLGTDHVLAGTTSDRTQWVQLAPSAGYQPFAGEGLEFDVPSLVRDNVGSITATTVGAQGDIMLLLIGDTTTSRALPGFAGDLLVTAQPGQFQRRFIGMGPTGTIAIDVDDVPPLSTASIYLQTAHLRPNPAATLGRDVLFGPARVVSILDAQIQ